MEKYYLTIENASGPMIVDFLKKAFNGIEMEGPYTIIGLQRITITDHTEDFNGCYQLISSGKMAPPDYFFAKIYKPGVFYTMISVEPVDLKYTILTYKIAELLGELLAFRYTDYLSLDKYDSIEKPIKEWNESSTRMG